jgi:hypothetical protein
MNSSMVITLFLAKNDEDNPDVAVPKYLPEAEQGLYIDVVVARPQRKVLNLFVLVSTKSIPTATMLILL